MVDLIVINVSLMLHDLISYFLLDYEFLLKKIRNVKLVKKVMEVRVCVFKGCEYVRIYFLWDVSFCSVLLCVQVKDIFQKIHFLLLFPLFFSFYSTKNYPNPIIFISITFSPTTPPINPPIYKSSLTKSKKKKTRSSKSN